MLPQKEQDKGGQEDRSREGRDRMPVAGKIGAGEGRNRMVMAGKIGRKETGRGSRDGSRPGEAGLLLSCDKLPHI